MEERDWDAETSRDEDENMEYLAEEPVENKEKAIGIIRDMIQDKEEEVQIKERVSIKKE